MVGGESYERRREETIARTKKYPSIEKSERRAMQRPDYFPVENPKDAFGTIRMARKAIQYARATAIKDTRGGAGGTNPYLKRGELDNVSGALKILRDAEKKIISSPYLTPEKREKLSGAVRRSAEKLMDGYVKPDRYSKENAESSDEPVNYIGLRSGYGPENGPIRDINEIEREDYKLRHNAGKGASDKRLEGKVALFLSVVMLLIGGVLVSSNTTGNAIVDLSTNTSSLAGGLLLAVGLVAGLFWLSGRKKKSS